MQEKVLGENSRSKLSVYTVWLPMMPGDSREKVPEAQKLLDDPRVSHFWDGKRELARWFKEKVLPSWREGDAAKFAGSSEEVEQFLGRPFQDEVIWDVYLLFGGQAKWDKVPEPLVGWGYPVVFSGEKLVEELKPLLG
ncbi:MAG: hypothetical protein V3U90_02965 [Dehalococcoidia bacterium]